MPTREEMIRELSKGQSMSSQVMPSREEMIAELSADIPPEKGTLQKIGEAVDSVTGAPTRSMISKAIENPTDIGGALTAFGKNFAGDSTKAPKGRDIAKQIGVNDNPAELVKAYNDPKSIKGLAIRSIQNAMPLGLGELIVNKGTQFLDKKGTTNADIAGLPIELAADWTNALPLLSMLKGSKAIKAIGAADELGTAAKAAGGVVDDAAKGVKMGGELGAAADAGLSAQDAIKLANEGGVKLTAKEVEEAAKRLGFKPTAGMVSNNPTLRGLESSLEQSPSIAGSLVRGDTNKVREGVTKAVSGLTKDTTSYSKFELGEKIKSGIIEKIAQRHAPIADQFNRLRESTAFIELPEKSKLTLARNFMQHPDVALAPNSSWGSKAQQFGDYLLNAKSVDDVKRLRTIVGKEIQASANPNEQRVLSSIYGSLTRLEENTIKRAAISQARTSKEGLEIGKQMLGELKSAKQGYKGLMTDIGDVTKAGGLKKSRTIEDFLDIVDNVPSEQIGDKLFKTNDLKSLSVIEKQFPSEFSLMRQQKVTELVEKATVKGQLDAGRLLKAVEKMGPETVKKIFGGNADAVLKDVETVLNSLPNKIGPSGTPQGEMFINMLRPMFQVQEGARFGAYKKLQNPSVPISNVLKIVESPSTSFKKAGQATVGGLSDLVSGAKKAQVGVGAARSLSDLIKDKK